jgi:hypothetical protein
MKAIKNITSGTGMEKASKSLMNKEVNEIVSISYTEMLLSKRGESKYFTPEYLDELHPEKNANLIKFLKEAQKEKAAWMNSLSYAPDVNFFKLSLPEYHRNQIHAELTDEEMSGWSKLLSDVSKNSAILKMVIKGLWGKAGFKGKGIDNLALHKCLKKEPKVVQFFVACSTNNELNKLGTLFNECLPNHIIRVLSGQNDATNATAEDIVKSDIEKCRQENKDGVVVISVGMASRSFSISETDAVVLMFDNGSIGSLIQKISRSLTGGIDYYGNPKKEGNVISLSFDPNRVDAVDIYLVEEANKNKMKSESLQSVVRRIRQSINIFEIDENGDPVELLVKDDYYTELIEKFDFDRLKNTQINLTPLFTNKELRNVILQINCSEVMKKSKKTKELKSKGKKFLDDATGKSNAKDELDKVDIQLLRHAIQTITTSTLSIVGIDGMITNIEKSFRSILDSINLNIDKKKEFVSLYGITPNIVIQLMDNEVINEQIIDICLSKY